MASLVTSHFRIHNAIQFFESFSETNPNIYYLFAGKSYAYANDAVPPTPVDSYDSTYYDFWRDIIGLKRIGISDVSHCIPRYNWTANTIYTQYTSNNASLVSSQFYVMTTQDNVYKCIDNNRGSQSTVVPTGTSSSIISTADNYRWKFLYTISAGEKNKFLTSNFIPVKNISANDSSAQWIVQQAAANGAINNITITSNGSGYLTTSNSFSSITNTTVVVLKSNAVATDDVYNGSSIIITSGLGSGQRGSIQKIVNYVGVTRTLTLAAPFTVTPNTSSIYVISPTVTVSGDSGSTSAKRATAWVSNTQGGQVRRISMIGLGQNYSTANVAISANSGSGATAIPIISPYGGHGSNPVNELFGKYIMMNTQLQGAESNTLPTNNDIRTIGIIRDPLLRNGSAAFGSVIDQTHRIQVNIVSGDFTTDEKIRGGTSGASGKLIYFANTNSARTRGTLKLIRLVTSNNGGSFVPGETLTGLTSGFTANVISYTRPALKEYTGVIIYNENRIPITRASDQIEDIKIILSF